jgi:carbon-monoxide dehydrogenase large subunit
LISADAFPYTTPTGTDYDCGNYQRAFDLALEMAGYDELRATQQARRAAGGPRQLGIGLSSYVEITNGVPEGEYGAVEIRPDGKAIVRTGTSPHGQGHHTAWSMLVSEQLGIAMEDIEVVHGDTDLVPRGVGTFGSRSLQAGGTAVNQAATEVVDKAKSLAADLLEADVADIVLDKVDRLFHVAGTPAISRGWGELAQAALDRDGAPLMAEVDLASPGATFPFGTHVAVVEVDTDTGAVEIVRHIAVDDAGRILNPLLAEGQVHGGIAQGAAQALLEEFTYDAAGNPLTANFADYSIISAAELPSFETAFTETPTPRNPLGAKGIGESGTIGSTPAVHNAVVDAVAHLGVRHIDMPTTPERVWQAIQAARSAVSQPEAEGAA